MLEIDSPEATLRERVETKTISPALFFCFLSIVDYILLQATMANLPIAFMTTLKYFSVSAHSLHPDIY